jgi:hypothetical protein
MINTVNLVKQAPHFRLVFDVSTGKVYSLVEVGSATGTQVVQNPYRVTVLD